jgi:hypothetical protein
MHGRPSAPPAHPKQHSYNTASCPTFQASESDRIWRPRSGRRIRGAELKPSYLPALMRLRSFTPPGPFDYAQGRLARTPVPARACAALVHSTKVTRAGTDGPFLEASRAGTLDAEIIQCH